MYFRVVTEYMDYERLTYVKCSTLGNCGCKGYLVGHDPYRDDLVQHVVIQIELMTYSFDSPDREASPPTIFYIVSEDNRKGFATVLL